MHISRQCDQDFYGGDTPFVQPAAEDNWVTKFPYEPGYEGQRVFPDESATYTLDGEGHEIKCFDFSNFKVSCEDSRSETTCAVYQKKNPFLSQINEWYISPFFSLSPPSSRCAFPPFYLTSPPPQHW